LGWSRNDWIESCKGKSLICFLLYLNFSVFLIESLHDESWFDFHLLGHDHGNRCHCLGWQTERVDRGSVVVIATRTCSWG
jgi:hypothetical protein